MLLMGCKTATECIRNHQFSSNVHRWVISLQAWSFNRQFSFNDGPHFSGHRSCTTGKKNLCCTIHCMSLFSAVESCPGTLTSSSVCCLKILSLRNGDQPTYNCDVQFSRKLWTMFRMHITRVSGMDRCVQWAQSQSQEASVKFKQERFPHLFSSWFGHWHAQEQQWESSLQAGKSCQSLIWSHLDTPFPMVKMSFTCFVSPILCMSRWLTADKQRESGTWCCCLATHMLCTLTNFCTTLEWVPVMCRIVLSLHVKQTKWWCISENTPTKKLHCAKS